MGGRAYEKADCFPHVLDLQDLLSQQKLPAYSQPSNMVTSSGHDLLDQALLLLVSFSHLQNENEDSGLAQVDSDIEIT